MKWLGAFSALSAVFAVALVASVMGITPAMAQDDHDHANAHVVNGQLNLGNVWSDLNLNAFDVGGDVNATSAAIGNSFSAEHADHAHVDTYQEVRGNVISTLDASVSDVDGDVNLTSAAVGNTASVHSHGGVPCPNDPDECPQLRAELMLTNRQTVRQVDPAAFLTVNANGVGSVTGTAAAIGNSLSVEASGVSNAVDTYQNMRGPTVASVNASVSNASGVDLTSAAVANTVSVDTLGD